MVRALASEEHMDSITQKEYWDEVRETAEMIAKECREHEQDRYDMLRERAGDHQWVIYTFYNFDVLKWTRNADAWEEVYGSIGEVAESCNCSSELYMRLASFAFGADVSDALADIPEDADEDEDEDETEAPAQAEGGEA